MELWSITLYCSCWTRYFLTDQIQSFLSGHVHPVLVVLKNISSLPRTVRSLWSNIYKNNVIYSNMVIIQVDSRRRKILDEVLVTWTLFFSGWNGFSSFDLADPVSEQFCLPVCADPAANLVIGRLQLYICKYRTIV